MHVHTSKQKMQVFVSLLFKQVSIKATTTISERLQRLHFYKHSMGSSSAELQRCHQQGPKGAPGQREGCASKSPSCTHNFNQYKQTNLV